MRYLLVTMALVLSPFTHTAAQVSIQIGLPGVSIGINQPVYPQMVAVPGYPVYYDPRASSNYFFYDGMYWVFQGDSWYASSWYDGPWSAVAPPYVPYFILRVPVSYYRYPPVYFRGWQRDGPPRWGEHWGNDWQRQHSGWDRWDRASAPRPAPLPAYQKQYSGNRYPRPEQQQELRGQNYRHEASDPAVKRVEAAHTVNRPAEQQKQQQRQQAQPKQEQPKQEQRQAQPKPQQQQQAQPKQEQPRPQQQAQPKQEPPKQAQAPQGKGQGSEHER
jgi:hypothetical protein